MVLFARGEDGWYRETISLLTEDNVMHVPEALGLLAIVWMMRCSFIFCC
jgi:hypothetical protein